MVSRTRRSRPHGTSVAEPGPHEYATATARVFQSGNSQAVRLPKQFRFKTKEVEIFRRGNDIVLRETRPRLSRIFNALPPLPDDALPDAIPDRAAERLPKL